MTKRTRINLLAATVLATGASALQTAGAMPSTVTRFCTADCPQSLHPDCTLCAASCSDEDHTESCHWECGVVQDCNLT
jgi:hypothetical protein